MHIVVDANIIIAALLGSRHTILLLLQSQHRFYSPAQIIDEILKHRQELCRKAKISAKEFEERFCALLQFIIIIRKTDYADAWTDAEKVMGKRDHSDIDYLACARLLKADFIWTNDADFASQSLVPCKTTAQFLKEAQHLNT